MYPELKILRQFLDIPRGEGWSAWPKPVVILDGVAHKFDPGQKYTGTEALVIGTNQASFEALCGTLSAATVTFYEMRVADIEALERLERTTQLALHWNTKLTDLRPLAALQQLEALALVDTPKATDLGPIGQMTQLRALEFSGSFSCARKGKVMTLAPLAALHRLKELCLTNLSVTEGGLRPLAACTALKRLVLSNGFETADYAFLAARLPDATCTHFAATVPVDALYSGEGIDTMVTGRRKPFLSTQRDRDRIKAFEARFDALKQRFAQGD